MYALTPPSSALERTPKDPILPTSILNHVIPLLVDETSISLVKSNTADVELVNMAAYHGPDLSHRKRLHAHPLFADISFLFLSSLSLPIAGQAFKPTAEKL